MNLENMSSQERKELERQLTAIRKEGLAKYDKGDLIADDIGINKGGGMVLKFNGSRFPVNLWASQLDQIIKHSAMLKEYAVENGIK